MMKHINILFLMILYSGSIYAVDLGELLVTVTNKSGTPFNVIISTTQEDGVIYESIIQTDDMEEIEIPISREFLAGELDIQINPHHTLVKRKQQGEVQLGVIHIKKEVEYGKKVLYRAKFFNLILIQGDGFIRILPANRMKDSYFLERGFKIFEISTFNAIKEERRKPASPNISKKKGLS